MQCLNRAIASRTDAHYQRYDAAVTWTRPLGSCLRRTPSGVATCPLVARSGDGLRPRSCADRVGLHRFAVADGRQTRVVVESGVAAIFVVVAAAAVTRSAWLLVLGLGGHGLKDLWQHRTQFVADTWWWPPFCLVVDWSSLRLSPSSAAASNASQTTGSAYKPRSRSRFPGDRVIPRHLVPSLNQQRHQSHPDHPTRSGNKDPHYREAC